MLCEHHRPGRKLTSKMSQAAVRMMEMAGNMVPFESTSLALFMSGDRADTVYAESG